MTDRVDATFLELVFRKIFKQVKEAHPKFGVGKSLQAIIMDWSDAERKAISGAVGESIAEKCAKDARCVRV